MLSKTFIRVCVPLPLVGLVAGIVPVMPALAQPVTPSTPPLHIVQGTVTQPITPGASFTVQPPGNQGPVTVTVTSTTRYYLVSVGRGQSDGNNQGGGDQGYGNGQGGGNRRQGNGAWPPAGSGAQSGNITQFGNGRGSIPGAGSPGQIPPNWRDNLGWLDGFNKGASFSDITAGDRVIARVDSNNMAWQVLIIQGPVIRQVRGTVTVTLPNIITVTPANSGVVVPPLTWGQNTEFIIKGATTVTTGYAVVTYNFRTNVALLVNFDGQPVQPLHTP